MKRKQPAKKLKIVPGKSARTKTVLTRSKVSVNENSNVNQLDQLLDKAELHGSKITMPGFVEPMQATRIEEPFNDESFIYEVKFDGYRIIARIENGNVKLFSRSGLDYTSKYPPVAEALSELNFDAIIDGEVVVLDESGNPNFDKLQKYGEGDTIAFYVFDLLWLDGYSMLRAPLVDRKRALGIILENDDVIKISDHFEDGIQLYEAIKSHGLEGIVAKKKNSIYEPGQRVKTWFKIPTEIRQEFVIGGWTESESARSFRSLLFGYFENGKFIYAGHSGGGYKENEMPKILARLKKLEVKKQPFVGTVETDTNTHWVKPEIVAEFKYATTTASGKIRKPAIFLGFREDKKASDVVREISIPLESDTASKSSGKKPVIKTSADSNWPELEKQKITSRTVHTFNGRQVELTNIEKPIWDNFTKAHLLMYYHSVYPFIIPHLKDRPESLHIKHKGIKAKGLYIKDMEGREPGWAEIFTDRRKHPKPGKRDIIDYLVCNDEATLQFIVNLGCIDINPWTSKIISPEKPDYIIIDLDPTIKDEEKFETEWPKVIETAAATREFLKKSKLIGFPKTSGKTGMHIYLPCQGFEFKEARIIAENICDQIHLLVPSNTTREFYKENRGTKLYIDGNQNNYSDTAAAPYSVRPFHQLQISTPLEWKEINDQLDPANFTVQVIVDRLKKKGDLFRGVHEKKIASANSKSLNKFL
jgi:bifunctional non-homologous end joining protein LigD